MHVAFYHHAGRDMQRVMLSCDAHCGTDRSAGDTQMDLGVDPDKRLRQAGMQIILHTLLASPSAGQLIHFSCCGVQNNKLRLTALFVRVKFFMYRYSRCNRCMDRYSWLTSMVLTRTSMVLNQCKNRLSPVSPPLTNRCSSFAETICNYLGHTKKHTRSC
jgi:hypothetical protein